MSISSKVTKLLIASALTMALAVPSFAERGHNFRDHDHGRPMAQHREPRHEIRHEHRRDMAYREHRREVAYREHRHYEIDHHRRPSGWDRGKKRGWGNSDVPPGQAKTRGSRPVFAHDRIHHHDPVYRSGAPAPVVTQNAPPPTVVYGKPAPSRTTQGGPPTVFGSKRQN